MLEFSGGCLCGSLRFKISAKPAYPHYCSCRQCQLWSGAPLVAWVEFPIASLEYIGPGGHPRLFRSSEQTQRGFCPECGSTIFAFDEGSDNVSITLACLDGSPDIVPESQSYATSAPSWFDR